MTKIRTYCDSCILIAAAISEDHKFFEIIDDPNREFASSIFVKLETIPKPHFNKFKDQLEFMETVFSSISIWPQPSDLHKITEKSLQIAKEYNLNGMDALHIATAIHLECSEMFSHEKPGKPMYSVQEIQVISLEKL